MTVCLIRNDAGRLRLGLAVFLFACLLTPFARSADTIEVEHTLGTTKAPVNPKRIVTFDLSILDSIDKLGVKGLSLAVPKQTMPPYLAGYLGDAVVDAGGMKEPNLERIYEFRPDLIFISARQTDYYDKLSEIAPTICANVEYKDFIGSFKRNMAMLDRLFGGSGAATAMADDMAAKAAATAAKAENGKTGLIIMVNDGALSVYGPGSRFGIIHDVLGVTPADPGIRVSTHGQSVDFEYIARINPDILFVISRNAAIGGNGSSTVLDNELIGNTKAGKSDKIVELNAAVWYLAGSGLESLDIMIGEVDNALN